MSKALCERAKTVIVEVNKNQPRCLGGYEEAIHISEVDYIVEGENPPLTQIPAPPISEVDKKVAWYIVEEMRDGCCVQLGIGGMPNAVGMMIAESDLKDLGCHTEMLVDAYVHMFNAGKAHGRQEAARPRQDRLHLRPGDEDPLRLHRRQPQVRHLPGQLHQQARQSPR